MKKRIKILPLLLFISIGICAQGYYTGESGSFSVTLSCDAYSEVNTQSYYISPSDGNYLEVTISAECTIDGWDGIDATDWAETLGLVTMDGLSTGSWEVFIYGTYVGDTQYTETFTFENEETVELIFYLETIWSMYDATSTFDVSYEVVD